MSDRGRGPQPDDGDVKTRLVLGLQPVREAIRAHGSALQEVLVETSAQPRLQAVARFARDRGVESVRRVPRAQLDRLSRGTSHQGVACTAPPLVVHPSQWLWEASPELVLTLDGIQDPQNFGAAIRSAVALANAPVLWPEHASAPLTPATFRASAGAIEHAQLVRAASLRQVIEEARAHEYAVVGLDARANETLQQLDLKPKMLLVLGAEHVGLSRGVKRACSKCARLTPELHLDSLNVSVAAGVALYEIMRQRGQT